MLRKLKCSAQSWVLFLACLLLLPTMLYGADVQSPPAPPPPPGIMKAPVLKMVSPGIFEIGKCRINKKENRVDFPATVNMTEGALEYLIVGAAGKLHESFLSTEVEPYALQVALLLAGMEGSTNPLAAQGESRVPEGDPISLTISISDNDAIKSYPAEHFILNGQEKIVTIPWVFTGSIIIDGVFGAQVDKSIVAVYHDPIALIDHQLPQGDNDEMWFVDKASAPPKGTAVTVSIKKL
jgi:hypothetical protein